MLNKIQFASVLSLALAVAQSAHAQPPMMMPQPMPQPPVRLGFQWQMCDFGMHVSALREGGMAQQIGLVPGDIVVQINAFQIASWDDYCLAMNDAVFNHGGRIELWFYRAGPMGYELQYVEFSICQEQIIVHVPCCVHVHKCHGPQVQCWTNLLGRLNQCWTQHCGTGVRSGGHCGLDIGVLSHHGGLRKMLGGHVEVGAPLQGLGRGNVLRNSIPGLQLNGNGPRLQKPLGSPLGAQIGSGFRKQIQTQGGSFSGLGRSMRSLSSNNFSPSVSSSMKSFSSSGGMKSMGSMKSFGGFGKR